MRKNDLRLNGSGYRDTTAEKAIRAAERDDARKRAIEKLQEAGYEPFEESGVLMLWHDGPVKEMNKEFKRAREIAIAAGYRRSMGNRQKKGEGND